MLNLEKLTAVLAVYKRDFSKRWSEEKFKWVAVKHFQQHWDPSANFAAMFSEATAKTGSLLSDTNYYPRSVIQKFAAAAPEETRKMFVDLFDEGVPVLDRVDQFKAVAAAVKEKYFTDGFGSHFQNENSISTYLWLRYPDKYYIYLYGLSAIVTKELESDFVPHKGDALTNLAGSFRLYDEICAVLQDDVDAVNLLRAALTDDCWPDTKLKTMTIDVVFYIRNFYSEQLKNQMDSLSGSPLPDQPSVLLSVEQWRGLLEDRGVFTADSLKMMKRLKDYGGAATCTQLAEKYGGPMAFYNSISSWLARRVADKMEMGLKNDADDFRWYRVLYEGYPADKNQPGAYVWKLRKELSRALDDFDLSGVPLYEKNGPAESKPGIELEKLSEPGRETEEKLEPVPDPDPYGREQFLAEVWVNEGDYDDLTALLKEKKNLILQGAPGVGKTFAARRLAWSMMGRKDENRVELVQFHQNYAYEDFVMGWRPQGAGFELRYGVFYSFCQKAAADPDRDYFFIIDEINRGNVSKIFGELLMMIEADKRGTEAVLACGTRFCVPDNLCLIGMMNTADRSLAMIDYALRRRFSFFTMKPAFDSDGFVEYRRKVNDETFDALVEQVEKLNREIAADPSLGRGFCIGHSYFCGGQLNADRLRRVVDFEILPMLEEYWFDQPEKTEEWKIALQGVFNE